MDNTPNQNPGDSGIPVVTRDLSFFDMFPVQAPPTHLFLLPEEIQALFFRALCAHCSTQEPVNMRYNPVTMRRRQQSLAACCLVSRQFRRLAQPHLYHRIQIGSTNLSGPSQMGPLLRLLYTLTHQPALASHVRSLVVNMNFTEQEMLLTREQRESIVSRALQRGVNIEACMRATDFFRVPIFAPRLDEISVIIDISYFSIAAILGCARNIDTLELLNYSWGLRPIFKQFTAPAQAYNLRLRRLRVRAHIVAEHSSDLAEVAWVFKVAPGITELEAANYTSFLSPAMDADRPSPDLFASLTRLDFFTNDRWQIDADDFEAMIRCTPRLERLTYMAVCPFGPHPTDLSFHNFAPDIVAVTPSEIVEILSRSPCRRTLTTLMIECPRSFTPEHTPGTIGTLRGLPRLKRLSIGCNALIGDYAGHPQLMGADWAPEDGLGARTWSQVLPPGLQELEIFNPGYRPEQGGAVGAMDLRNQLSLFLDDLRGERARGEAPRMLRRISVVMDSSTHQIWDQPGPGGPKRMIARWFQSWMGPQAVTEALDAEFGIRFEAGWLPSGMLGADWDGTVLEDNSDLEDTIFRLQQAVHNINWVLR